MAGRRQEEDDEDDDEEDDSSDDETEDEEGEQVTAEVDAAILRTLAKIRSGDADIYDSEKRVFDEEKALAAASALLPKATKDRVAASSSSGKKVTLADYQRSRLRDLMKNSEDPALALAEATTSTTRQDEEMYGGEEERQPLSHVQEQEQLRKQVTQAFHTMGDDDEAADGFFTRKDDADEVDDPEAYRKYLLANLGSKKAEQAVREALRYQAAEASREAAAAAGPSSAPADAPASSTSADASASKADKKQRKSTKSQEQTNEDFLMNYVLNRGWMDKPHAAPKLARRPPPTRKEEATKGDDDRGAPAAAGPSSNGAERDWEAEAAQLSDVDDAEDSDFDNRAEAFEQAFNFRYEAMEAGAAPAQVTSYARGKDAQQNSVRRVEDKRKREREERKARKEEEKRLKREELDRLRDLKRGQLREKLKQLKEAAGSANVDFDVEKLEGDFDAEEHDRMMAVFGDAYYDEEGDDYGPDDFEGGKPSWADDIDIDDILADEEREEEEAGGKKSKKGKKDKKRGAADMDVDGEDEEDVEGDQKLSKKERKKLKKKAKRAEKLGAAATNGEGEPSSSSFSSALPQTDAERRAIATRLIDEYRDLDYEDVIGGDLPTRFHYTQVPKVNYGMSAVEILLADDKDLNDVVGLKQMQPYRRGGGLEGAASKRSKELNRRLKEFRRKLDRGEEDVGAAALEGRAVAGGKRKRRGEDGASAVGGENGEKSEQQPAKKRMGKKERQKLKAAAEAQAAAANGDGGEVEAVAPAASSAAAAAEVPAQANGSEEKESKEEKRRRKEEKKARKQAKAEAEAGEAPRAKKVKLEA